MKKINTMNKKDQTAKYIFVTGGVISGVGKGIMAASIGTILKAKGLKVSMQKCDPYFSVDAGLLDPREHGECYVTRDGAETDLDLGHYERFLDEEMTGNSTWTSGKLYKRLIEAERAGKFGGRTVQLVPHVTGIIQETFIENVKYFGSDVHIVEIGGTVGDMEGQHFIEAIREFAAKVGKENCLFVHVCYIPWLLTSNEFKTKPAQNSIRDLREFGIIPDMVVARMDTEKVEGAKDVARKLATFCGVREDAVVLMPDAKSVYEVPVNAVRGGVLVPLERFIDHGDPDMTDWEKLAEKIDKKYAKNVKVGLAVTSEDNSETHLSVIEALKAAAWANDVGLTLVWLETEKLKEGWLDMVDGILAPGAFSRLGFEGKIEVATYALEHDKPYLGIGMGMQAAAIAAARKGGLERATSEEFGKEGELVCRSRKNGRMRIGNDMAKLKKGSGTEKIYNAGEVVERHRQRYEVDDKFEAEMKKGGLEVTGVATDGEIDFMEAPDCKFFQVAAGELQFRSRPMRAHPLFREFIRSLK